MSSIAHLVEPPGAPLWRVVAAWASLLSQDFEAALDALWESTSGRLWRYFVRFGVAEEQADDLVQDVFARLVDEFDRFDGRDLVAWMFTVARYELMSHRQRVRRGSAREDELPDSLPAESDAFAVAAQAELVGACEVFRSRLDAVGAEIYDALGGELSDDELLRRIEAGAGARLTLGALRGRRMRLREALDEHLRSGGHR